MKDELYRNATAARKYQWSQTSKEKKKTTSPTVQFSVFLVAMGTGNWNWDSLRIDC